MPAGLRCVLVWLSLAPLAGGAGAPGVTLGLIVPPSEPDALSLLRGARLAVAEENGAGRAPVGLEVRSENGQWGSAGNDAVELVSNRHVDAIITPSDGAASHLILQVSGRTRVPVASVCPDSSVTRAGVPWVVRVVARTDQEAEVLLASARLPGRPPVRWWAFVPTGRPGRAVRRDLEAAARSASSGLDRVVDSGDPHADPADLVNPVVAAGADGVLLWLAPAQAGRLASALRAAGYRGRLAGPGRLDSPEFFAAAGAAAAGVLVTGFRADADLRARADRFEGEFRREYKVQPDFSAAAAHDAARVLIEALRRAGNGAGRSPFPVSLPTEGVTGVLHFDDSGNRTDALQVLTCQQGRFVPIHPDGT